MARAPWMIGNGRPAAVLGMCAFLCAVLLVVSLAAPVMRSSSSLPTAAAISGGGVRRLLLPATRSRRFRPRRWNSAGFDENKHEVPSGPNPDSNR